MKRKEEQQKIHDLQIKAFDKLFKEAQKSHSLHDMKMHEISELHAEALLKVGEVKVYGFTPSGFVLIQTIDKFADFDKYFID